MLSFNDINILGLAKTCRKGLHIQSETNKGNFPRLGFHKGVSSNNKIRRFRLFYSTRLKSPQRDLKYLRPKLISKATNCPFEIRKVLKGKRKARRRWKQQDSKYCKRSERIK